MTKAHIHHGSKPRYLPDRAIAVFRYFLPVFLLMTAASYVAAQDNSLPRKPGNVTGFPVPRFVSLKSDEVNVRAGPGKDYAIAWVFRRAGLAVEVIAEFDTWRQIRDSESATGWVSASLLSGRRAGVVAPWSAPGTVFDLTADDREGSERVARVEKGAIVDIVSCDGQWCDVYAGAYRGYIAQPKLWGVYPNETIR